MTEALAIADIHLDLSKNKKFEQDRFLQLFKDIKQDPASVVFLLGDTFNRATPSLEEIGLFYKAISLLHDKKVYIIDGNHEGVMHGTSTFDYIPAHGFRYIKDDQIKIDGVRLYLVSWTEIHKLQDKVKGGISSLPNILLTHIRCTVPPHIKEEIPTNDIASKFDKVVAGDIHITNFKPYDNWYYTGQPYNTTFKRQGLNSYLRLTFDKGVVEIDTVYTKYPNKILQVLNIEDVKSFSGSSNNLYKIRTEGTFSELSKLPTLTNVVYDKQLQEADTTEFEVKSSSTIDVAKDIKVFIREEYDFSDKTLTYGDRHIDKILQKEVD